MGDGGDDVRAGGGGLQSDEGGGRTPRGALADDGADTGESVSGGDAAPVVAAENVGLRRG